MGIFNDITVRENGFDIEASWFNTIRSKLISAFGAGVSAETPVTIADNQSSYQDITGLLVDGNDYGSATIRYTIYRTDGTNERRETGYLEISFKQSAETWTITDRRSGGDDALNIADSINVSTTAKVGQLQYKSDAMGGTYNGKITFKIVNTTDIEDFS